MDVSRDEASYRKQAEVYSQDRSDRVGSWVLYRVIQKYREKKKKQGGRTQVLSSKEVEIQGAICRSKERSFLQRKWTAQK